MKSTKKCLSYLANRVCSDNGSLTKQNLNFIEQESGIDNVLQECNSTVASCLDYAKVPEEEEWRLGFLDELMKLRREEYCLDNDQFTKAEITELINFVCTS